LLLIGRNREHGSLGLGASAQKKQAQTKEQPR